MSRFPFFKEISGSRALIVGGGPVALRRARTLAQCGAEVICVAPGFCEGFEELPVHIIRRKFVPGDIDGCAIVVLASDDREVNADAAQLAHAQGCEVCVSDDPGAGTFFFPAVIGRGGMTVAVSSDGASPSAVKYVRQKIEEVIPEDFEEVLKTMETARSAAKELILSQKERAEILRRIFDHCLKAPAQPDKKQLEDMIRRFRCTELD